MKKRQKKPQPKAKVSRAAPGKRKVHIGNDVWTYTPGNRTRIVSPDGLKKYEVFRGEFFLTTPDEIERADRKGYGNHYVVSGGVVKDWILMRIIGFKCPECGQGTVREQTLENHHWKSVGISRAVLGYCNKCDKYTVSDKELKRWERIVCLRRLQEEQEAKTKGT